MTSLNLGFNQRTKILKCIQVAFYVHKFCRFSMKRIDSKYANGMKLQNCGAYN